MLHLRIDVEHFAGKVPLETNKSWTIDDYKNIDNTMDWLFPIVGTVLHGG